VFVEQEGIAQLTDVDVGKSDGLLTEVISGLNEADMVVLYPSAAIENGSIIAPRAP
jgi:HlyD family secretion protein